ncbi:NAD(P)/FAD-dependent oxidoreductase [Rhodococcus sp. H29-C3]|uniref:NAD(P)/FAD-dependent oxidoreductase n=1 Tax=Rhodococcus sp. H29-C3 TaxID=3046307 RepID=UPI0024BA4911|nr:NAD(P)/FAD-dependent oxidoreductase [Rhodococcus sp. H29-C3]MDJ0363081.1 NAD(P)/FAD-dependent oxidoreductase [Rhodococcus sp. H29-C3]
MYDVVIVGAGASGLSAALVLGRQKRSVLVIDGGKPRNAPAAEMHMYLGRDGGAPAQLLADGRAEIDAYPTVERVAGQVSAVGGVDGAFEVTIGDGAPLQAHKLFFATGVTDVPWEIPGLAELWGSGVFHCPFCHGFETDGLTLAVLANGSNAALAAYVADRFSDDVVVCTDGPSTIPDPLRAMLDKVGAQVVETPVTHIEGELGSLTVHFADGSVLERQALYHRAPTTPNTTLTRTLGCEHFDDGCVRVDEFGKTTVPGVSAGGDAAHLAAVPEPVTLVASAAADGVRAAVWLEQDLFSEAFAS